jgi:hypothetical protein
MCGKAGTAAAASVTSTTTNAANNQRFRTRIPP